MLLQGAQDKRFIIWLVPALSLLLTVFATLYVRHGIIENAIAQFSFSADQIQIKVRERLESYELILRGGAALFESSDAVSRHEWHHFVSKLEAERIVPGVQGVGFLALIRPEALAAHAAGVRAEGFADYQVWPAGSRDSYAPVVYLEPLAGANLRAFGYDVLSEPVRRAALERACDTGLPALSGKVTLVQETGSNPQPGMLMFVPVYKRDLPTGTVEQRRLALLGWAYSPYRMNDFMTGILHGWESSDGRYVDLHIYDGLDAMPANSLFDGEVHSKHLADAPFFQQRRVEFYGHAWLLEFDRLPSAPDLDYQLVWLVFFGGIAFSGLLHLLLAACFFPRDGKTCSVIGTTRSVIHWMNGPRACTRMRKTP